MYVVVPRMAADLWELHITDEAGAEVGVTQVHVLDDAEYMVRDYLRHDGVDAGVALDICRPAPQP